ncbi:Phospholipase D3-like [Oopsacas minuta]|uniref:Phospholipase D3-like n=1 Tax=Oopsacas minuta TaxID=111878 RepID=A0AAV7JVW8_9METZ|nr:Phospholipase D3-like [Oopsacas minuta]
MRWTIFYLVILVHLVPVTTLCQLKIVESIPQNLTYPGGSPTHESTFKGWADILNLAKNEVNISSFYMTLKGSDTKTKDPSTKEGEQILTSLKLLGGKGVTIRIVEEISSKGKSDSDQLEKLKLAQVQHLNMSNFGTGGILHTKFIFVDGKHMYVGSANMDWRSLTQVKELGILAINCPTLVQDAAKIFEVYWQLSKPGAKLPHVWPPALSTSFNMQTPMKVDIGGGSNNPYLYLSSAPYTFCPTGRTRDLNALLNVIRSAEKFVWIAVMDYIPAIIYNKPYQFWPVIDDELRRAAIERNINIRVMASYWSHTKEQMLQYLCSLTADSQIKRYPHYGGWIDVKLFEVPVFTPEQKSIPFARVNHNKYMVTDNKGYIGTSNWTGDYFNSTAGVSVTIQQKDGNNSLPQQLRDIFSRDWDSKYAKPIICNGSVF